MDGWINLLVFIQSFFIVVCYYKRSSVGAELAQRWRSVGAGLAHGWRRVGVTLAQGWRSGENFHLPPMCPEFDSRTVHHMWAELAGSLPCSEGFFFLRVLRFSPFPQQPKQQYFPLILFDLS